MIRRAALLFLALASPAVLVTFAFPGPAAQVLFAILAMAYPVALIAMAVSHRSRSGPLALPLLAFLLLLEGCIVAMLLLRGRVLDGPWIGGLPLAAAIQIYGLWLAPLLLVALFYAFTFDRYELREEDLERLEALRVRREGDG